MLCVRASSNNTTRTNGVESETQQNTAHVIEPSWVVSLWTHPQRRRCHDFGSRVLFESFMKSTKVQCQRNKKKCENKSEEENSREKILYFAHRRQGFPTPSRVTSSHRRLLAATPNTIEWNKKNLNLMVSVKLNGNHDILFIFYFVFFFSFQNIISFLISYPHCSISIFPSNCSLSLAFFLPSERNTGEQKQRKLFIFHSFLFPPSSADIFSQVSTSFPYYGGYDNTTAERRTMRSRKKEVEKIDTNFSNVSSQLCLLSSFFEKDFRSLCTRFSHLWVEG